MIASVSGTIEYKGAGRLVVQVGGVGLRLRTADAELY